MPGISFFLHKVLKKEISASQSRFWGDKGNWEEERVSEIHKEKRFGNSCDAGGIVSLMRVVVKWQLNWKQCRAVTFSML